MVNKGRQEMFDLVDDYLFVVLTVESTVVWLLVRQSACFNVQILGIHASLIILRMNGNS